MDVPHKQVKTTYPVALKYGQGRLHVANPIPWHFQSETVKCPECEILYILSGGFSKLQFLEILRKLHQDQKEHPDLIPSAPEWTSIADCDCAR